jgi:hypothetical protein
MFVLLINTFSSPMADNTEKDINWRMTNDQNSKKSWEDRLRSDHFGNSSFNCWTTTDLDQWIVDCHHWWTNCYICPSPLVIYTDLK